MKYNININQKELADTGLDIKDSAILDYLYFYCNSNSEKISYHRLEGEWTWVDYNSIIKDMPLLRTKSPSVISKRISKLVKEGFVETHRPDHMKTYIKLTDKVDTLFVNTNSPIRKKEQGLGGTYSFLRTNNNTIDNNTKDTIAGKPAMPSKKEFSLDEELRKLRNVDKDKERWKMIIADYISYKALRFKNNTLYQQEFKRCVKPARELGKADCSQKELLNTFKYCDDNFKTWTLNAVLKNINHANK